MDSPVDTFAARLAHAGGIGQAQSHLVLPQQLPTAQQPLVGDLAKPLPGVTQAAQHCHIGQLIQADQAGPGPDEAQRPVAQRVGQDQPREVAGRARLPAPLQDLLRAGGALQVDWDRLDGTLPVLVAAAASAARR